MCCCGTQFLDAMIITPVVSATRSLSMMESNNPVPACSTGAAAQIGTFPVFAWLVVLACAYTMGGGVPAHVYFAPIAFSGAIRFFGNNIRAVCTKKPILQ